MQTSNRNQRKILSPNFQMIPSISQLMRLDLNFKGQEIHVKFCARTERLVQKYIFARDRGKKLRSRRVKNT